MAIVFLCFPVFGIDLIYRRVGVLPILTDAKVMPDFRNAIVNLVRAALAEDIGSGDLTSLACLEPIPAKARVVAKSDGILSGLDPFHLTCETVDSANVVTPLISDGDPFKAGDTVIEIAGFNQTLLASERVALNFLAHLSGIATLTRKFVDKIKHTNCQVLATRKTTPGWRYLEKASVVHGGGSNHRLGLYDMVLIKDNHIASVGSIEAAVAKARDFLGSPDFRLNFDARAEDIVVEVEVVSTRQVREAIKAGADRLLLDNQSVDSLRELVTLARQLKPSIKLEASGNITLDNIVDIAGTGVDCVSIGAITHSAPASDFSMQLLE
jgi:nicotinate-nucleotide pyrophosphorylase (carboxylating)